MPAVEQVVVDSDHAPTGAGRVRHGVEVTAQRAPAKKNLAACRRRVGVETTGVPSPRVFESFWRSSPAKVDSFDYPAFLSRLLLFDTLIIESPQLLEVAPIVHLLGFRHTLELIESRALRFVCDPLTVGSMDSTSPQSGVKLPPTHFNLNVIRVFDPAGKPSHVSQQLASLLGIEGLRNKEAIKLKSAIGRRIERYPLGYGTESIAATLAEVDQMSISFRAAVAGWFHAKRNEHVEPAKVEVGMKRLSDDIVEITSNVGRLYGVEPRIERKAIQAALLEVAGINDVFECMKAFDCVTPLAEAELNHVDTKLRFVQQRFISPVERVNELDKVLRALELPSFEEAASSGRIDVDKLLEIRAGDEVRVFRDWLQNARSLSEADLREIAKNIRARVGRGLGTTAGKLLRMLPGIAVSLVDPTGFLAGTALSAIDSFVVDRVFKSPALVTFFQRDLPSLFEPSKDGEE